jgi:thiamine-phosphate pyrophosphorylase
LVLLVANDPALVDRTNANGLHLSEASIRQSAAWRARRPNWLITATAHSFSACGLAGRAGAHAAFLSPVLATPSHPEGRYLGAARTRLMARQSAIPVYALGGIDEHTARSLAHTPFAGIAGIGALAL